MVDRVPSTSYVDVEFDEDFMTNARRMPLEQMEKALQMLRDETHPLYTTVIRRQKRCRQLQEDRNRCHRERAERKVTEDYERKEAEFEQEYNAKTAELLEEARKRSEDLDRSTIHEYGVVDIQKPPAIPLVFESNKKTLRGRGGGQLIEPANYLNSNQGVKSIPEFNYKLAFEDIRIRKDLDYCLNRPDSRRKLIYVTSIQKPKITVDGRTFKHGEDVYASNTTYGEFHAKMDLSDPTHVVFKATQAWDPRVITASQEDFEEGRVTVAKCRGKDRMAS